MRVSFIIPVKELNDYVLETVEHLQRLDGGDWEAFVVTNDEQDAPWDDERIAIVASGRVGPADKRDLAATIATGEILVFLDDDSYPASNYLAELRKTFVAGHVAVGGPAVTPLDDSYWRQVSGAVFLSRLTGGAPERYVPIYPARPVEDWPSVNLAIRRSLFLRVGGFACPFWPGEDTFLCDKLTSQGVRIWYQPDIVVWHHRRETLGGHLRQIGNYGLHRGYFARRFGQSSLRPAYFAPSVLILVLLCALALAGTAIAPFFWALSALYVISQLVGVLVISRRTGVGVAVGSLAYVFPTHLWYGWQFIRGLVLTRHLTSQLR